MLESNRFTLITEDWFTQGYNWRVYKIYVLQLCTTIVDVNRPPSETSENNSTWFPGDVKNICKAVGRYNSSYKVVFDLYAFWYFFFFANDWIMVDSMSLFFLVINTTYWNFTFTKTHLRLWL